MLGPDETPFMSWSLGLKQMTFAVSARRRAAVSRVDVAATTAAAAAPEERARRKWLPTMRHMFKA